MPIAGNAPIGLLSMLDAKSMGDNPRNVIDSVQPTLETQELFLLNRREFVDNLAVAAVLNSTVLFTNLTVPQNEWWYVWHFDVQSASLGAGTAIRIIPQLHIRTSADIAVGTSDGAVGAASTEQALAIADRPFWANPGSVLAFLSEQLTGAVNVSGHALISRLKI